MVLIWAQYIFFPMGFVCSFILSLRKMHTFHLKSTEEVINFKPEYLFLLPGFMNLNYHDFNFYLFITYPVPGNA